MLNYLRDPENNSKIFINGGVSSCASFSDKLIITLLVPVLSGPWTAPPQRGVSSLPPLPLVEFQRKTDPKA